MLRSPKGGSQKRFVAGERLFLYQLPVELDRPCVIASAEGPVGAALQGGRREEACADYGDRGDGHPGQERPSLSVVLDYEQAEHHQEQGEEGEGLAGEISPGLGPCQVAVGGVDRLPAHEEEQEDQDYRYGSGAHISPLRADRSRLEATKNLESRDEQPFELLIGESGPRSFDGDGFLEPDPGFASAVLIPVRKLDHFGEQLSAQDED